MYWQCTDESLSPRRKQNHTTKFFTEVTQFYSFILSRRCLRRSGQSRREKNNKICVKIEFYFFSISSKNNVGGSVNHKIKKVWPYYYYYYYFYHSSSSSSNSSSSSCSCSSSSNSSSSSSSNSSSSSSNSSTVEFPANSKQS